jgi:spore coat-associated protein N
MKKILGLGIAALLIMAMVGGGTWAYFVDTETSSGNLLTAGTLNLGVANVGSSNPTGSTTATWTSPSGWKPGDNISAVLYVKNSGTIAMSSVNVTFSAIFTDGTPSSVSGYNQLLTTTGNFTKMVNVLSATWNGVDVPAITGQTLDYLMTAGSINLGALANGTEYPLFINWKFDPTATNACQGDSANITLTLTANQ